MEGRILAAGQQASVIAGFLANRSCPWPEQGREGGRLPDSGKSNGRGALGSLLERGEKATGLKAGLSPPVAQALFDVLHSPGKVSGAPQLCFHFFLVPPLVPGG